MLITKLQIAGLRSFEQATFIFQSGMNLIVGVNGVGKTTVLDVLRICLSKIFPEITSSRSSKLSFELSDIRFDSDTTQVFCEFELDKHIFSYTFQQKLSNNPVPGNEDYVYEQINRPSGISLPNYKELKNQPIAIYYSTRRSLIDDKIPSKERVSGGQAAAFAESLITDRGLRLRLIAQWFKAQEVLGEEDSIALKHIEALKSAVTQFLPNFTNLRVVGSDEKTAFRVDKLGMPLPISQLSDGERGVLAIVLDLARRLSQANPGLENPVKDGVAVVLIDELDLHLHPKWQRTVVENLTRTFPKCQFIATTHSPQIIPAVEPERVQLLKDNKVIRPDRTLGMDSNWILRHIMEADDRPEEALEAIEHVEKLVNEGSYEEARNAMVDYRQQRLDLPEWSTLEARIARFETFDEE